MRRIITILSIVILVFFSTCNDGIVFASTQINADYAVKLQKEIQTKAQAEPKTVGKNSVNSKKLVITNHTGKDIGFIQLFLFDPDHNSFREVKSMQEALIGLGFLNDTADGSFGPKTQKAVADYCADNNLEEGEGADGRMLNLLYNEYGQHGKNMLGPGEVIHDNETVILTTDQTAKNNTSKSEYHILFSLKNNKYEEYVLHVLPSDEKEEAQILIKNDVAYIEYANERNQKTISTYAAEKMISDQELSLAVVPTEGSDRYFTDNYHVDSYVEDQAKKILDQIGWNLYSAYKWSVQIPYIYGNTGNSVTLSAIYGFTKKIGDCTAKASTFCIMARLLGYECQVIYGRVPYRSGGFGDHAWTEIQYDGTTCVCDPEFEWNTGINGYMFNYGQPGTWMYQYGYILNDY